MSIFDSDYEMLRKKIDETTPLPIENISLLAAELAEVLPLSKENTQNKIVDAIYYLLCSGYVKEPERFINEIKNDLSEATKDIHKSARWICSVLNIVISPNYPTDSDENYAYFLIK